MTPLHALVSGLDNLHRLAFPTRYGVKSLRQKVSAGCQLFHTFDYAFDYNQKVDL